MTPLDLSYVLKTMAVSKGVLGVDEPGTFDFLGWDFFCTFLHIYTHIQIEKRVGKREKHKVLVVCNERTCIATITD